MVKFLGHWELGYHAPVTEQFYWAYPLRDFGHADWNMIPVSGVKNKEQGVNLTEWDDYESFFKEFPDLKRVFVEPRTLNMPPTTWLHEYTHPEDCVYITGSAHYNPVMVHYREGIDDIITVKTDGDAGVLWADQVTCIVMYDRQCKQWQ